LAVVGAGARADDGAVRGGVALARDLVALLAGFRAADLLVEGDFLVEVLATNP
jgi:hypothetical protein